MRRGRGGEGRGGERGEEGERERGGERGEGIQFMFRPIDSCIPCTLITLHT